MKTEALLRQLGFGYRANFIPWSAAHLIESAAALGVAPEAYLRSFTRSEFSRNGALRSEDDKVLETEPVTGEDGVVDGPRSIRAAREKLLEFKGVGRKVADCVLLFGLGWSETVPVDTHVFQIAIRDYSFPATRNANLSPALHDKVSEFLADKWGPYAGWAQQILFFADLKSASTSPTKAQRDGDGTRRMTLKVEVEEELSGSDGEDEAVEKVRKLTFEEEVAALIANPGTKRRRSSAAPLAKVKVEVERFDGPEGARDPDELAGAQLRIKEEVTVDTPASPPPRTNSRPPLKQRRTNSATSIRKSRSRTGTIKEEET